MFPVIIVAASLSVLVVLNRRGRIGNELFATAVVMVLSGLAGYYGVLQY